MRLTRTLTLGAVVAMVAAVGAPAAHATPARQGLLYLGSGSAITAISPETGAVQFTKTPAIATRDWSRLYSTQSMSSATVLTTSDARNGKTLATRRLAPNLGVRAVSDDGQAVVLTEGLTGANPYVPQPRSTTALTVVRVGEKPRTYLVHGNVEPEAFSVSTRSLFVIEYTPPTAPDRYRVARIDLTNQHVGCRTARGPEQRGRAVGADARHRTRTDHGAGRTPLVHAVHTRRHGHRTGRVVCPRARPATRTGNVCRPSPRVRFESRRRRRGVAFRHPSLRRGPGRRCTRRDRHRRAPHHAHGAASRTVDRYDGASDRRRKHKAVRRHGRRGHLGGPRPTSAHPASGTYRGPSPASNRRRRRAPSSSRSPIECSRSTRRRAPPSASSFRSTPARSTTSRPRSARSCRKTAPTSSAPAER